MKRREFLKRMGIGGAAVGASVLAGKALGKTEILDKATAPGDTKTLEKTPFKRHIAKGWDLKAKTWCGRCGFVQIPGPFTLCCTRPLLEVAMHPQNCVILGKAGAEQITGDIQVENWGTDSWDHDREWRERAHKVGLSIPVTTTYAKGWNW